LFPAKKPKAKPTEDATANAEAARPPALTAQDARKK
jgi:hypothetical protein